MRFTKYYNGVVKNQGIPNLNSEQYCRLMNIISLEGRLQELMSLKEKIKDPAKRNQYDIRILTLEGKLAELTSRNYPKYVLNDMLIRSR